MCNAKDIAFDSCIVARNGVLDNKSYSRVAETLLAISHGRLGAMMTRVETNRQRFEVDWND